MSITKKLWLTLQEMNFHPHLIYLIKSLYKGQQSAVQLECGTTEWFPVKKGVRQGCILSPHLFSLYTEGIMREVEHDHRRCEYNEARMQGLTIRDLRYADDTVLLATTPNRAGKSYQGGQTTQRRERPISECEENENYGHGQV